jgi:hypothetical protein
MKKHLQLFFSLFLAWDFSFAQTFSIGTKNGVSNTSISGRFAYKNFDDAQIRYNTLKVFDQRLNISKFKKNSSGYLKQFLEFVLNCSLDKNISLQSEFEYEEKGFDFYHILYGGGANGFYKMQYLTIPLSFVYESGKTIKYYGYIGISLNLLLRAGNYTRISVGGVISNYYDYYDESYRPSEFNKKELEALTGIGIKIPLSNKVKFIVDAGYSNGITRAAKNTDYIYNSNFYSSETPNNFQNVFNRSISLCWGGFIT